MAGGESEHADAVAAAREHLAAAENPARPLRTLPEDFAETRTALHVVAEHLLRPKRVMETGEEIALQFTPGGFGTPPWERGEASGQSGQARVEGDELVHLSGGEERRTPVGEMRSGAELFGLDAAGVEPGEGQGLDPEAAARLADWFAFATVALAELLERREDAERSPIRLWPEDFDVACELGSPTEGGRGRCGASPGDDEHAEPYLYVRPSGGELAYEDLLDADDQVEAAVEFMVGELDL